MKEFLFLVLLSGSVFAAPDEALLGKADGYPVCPVPSGSSSTLSQRCLVGLLSNYEKRTATSRDGTARGPQFDFFFNTLRTLGSS